MGKFYVTTPIYYVNDVPHVGHAYSTIAADVLSRFYRSLDYDVFFLTGTDEHGQKVAKAAEERGLDVQKHVDEMVVPFKELWKRLEIDSGFIRTTEKRHEIVVQAIFEKLREKGDIYPGKYEGWYCIFEETFYPESQIEEGKCPECSREVKWVSEDSYFFKTSNYIPRLHKHIEENPDFIMPKSRRNEVLSYIESGVQDVSVSRTAIKWGVKVPGDEKHVVYVWFDALINYLSGIGYHPDKKKQDPNFKKFWPADVHIIGKDILKFHAVIWPAMLMALGEDLPKMIFAHGFLTVGGEKISKSRGKVIDPNELIDKYGADAYRYFFMSQFTFGLDGEYTEETMIKRINADLANDLGNLVHRTANMMKKYYEGNVPNPKYSQSDKEGLTRDIKIQINGIPNHLKRYLKVLDFSKSLAAIWHTISLLNKYIEDMAPWQLHKEERNDELAKVMYTLADGIRAVAQFIYPFMPQTAEKIWKQIGATGDLKRFPETKPDIKDLNDWVVLKPGSNFKIAEPLFPRIEE
ncbi:MAG: methionine--tRNA ligase [Actinobacteria bacterium]|nr:MAG: methionine--tRNA ligase [Actinomycetota bacterium]